MKTHRKYIFAEILGPYFIGLFAFTLVVLLHRFSLLSDLVVARGVPASLVGTLLLSLFPGFLQITLPAALLLAVLLALGRMSSDAEITAIHAAGVGSRSIVPPVLLLCAATFLSSLFIGWGGLAWGQRTFKSTLARIVSVKAGSGASEHVFQEIAPGILLYPDRVSADGTTMSGVLLTQRVEGQEPLLVFAREGVFLPERPDAPVTLALSDGAAHYEEERTGTYRLASFRTMEFRLPRAMQAGADRNDPRAMTIPQLARRIAETGWTGKDAAPLYHLHRRLSLAVSCVAFGLLAVPLGLSQKSRGRSPAVGYTVLVIIVYYVFLAAGRALANSSPPAMVALLWLPNAAALYVSGWIFLRSDSRIVALPDILRRWKGTG